MCSSFLILLCSALQIVGDENPTFHMVPRVKRNQLQSVTLSTVNISVNRYSIGLDDTDFVITDTFVMQEHDLKNMHHQNSWCTAYDSFPCPVDLHNKGRASTTPGHRPRLLGERPMVLGWTRWQRWSIDFGLVFLGITRKVQQLHNNKRPPKKNIESRGLDIIPLFLSLVDGWYV